MIKKQSRKENLEEHREFLKDTADMPDNGPSRYKKYLLHAASFIVIIMLIVYIVPYESFDALHGILLSDNLEDDSITKGDIKIIFEEEALAKLQEHYKAHQNREIKACLLGKLDGQTRYVTDVIFPNIYFASVIRVVSSGCPDNALIDLHSHPINRCAASEQDLSNLEKNKKTNPELLMAIMCNVERFAVYS